MTDKLSFIMQTLYIWMGIGMTSDVNLPPASLVGFQQQRSHPGDKIIM
jgi:hypothetical protein